MRSVKFDAKARRVLSFVLLLLTLCVPSGVHAQSGAGAADRERLAQFQQSLDSLRRQYGIPGLSAVIVNNGRIIWEAGFGFQDVENQIPATPDTPYRTASITKTFASMLLMKCVERGTLNLDTPDQKLHFRHCRFTRHRAPPLYPHIAELAARGELLIQRQPLQLSYSRG